VIFKDYDSYLFYLNRKKQLMGDKMKNIYIYGVLLIVLVIALGGYIYYNSSQTTPSRPTNTGTQTTTSALNTQTSAATATSTTTATTTTTSTATVPVLNGAGSSLAAPLVQQWASQFKVKTGITVSYQSVGSGKGQSMFFDRTVDFGATDPPLTQSQYGNYSGNIAQIPIVTAAVAVTYNLPEIPKNVNLNLTGCVLAKIYSGLIKKWNDPEIKSLNPQIANILPDKDIIVVYRSDASGTTNIYTLFLNKSCPDVWTSDLVGFNMRGNITQLPTATAQKGSEGVTAFISSTPYSIGYVEVQYAKSANLGIAALRNPAGSFVIPTNDSIVSAINAVVDKLPSSPYADWSYVPTLIIYVNSEKAYPLVTFTFELFWKNYNDTAKQNSVKAWVNYILTEGQQNLLDGYFPLPSTLANNLLKNLGWN
jgi:phosphate transport system substrate-binding protein